MSHNLSCTSCYRLDYICDPHSEDYRQFNWKQNQDALPA